MNQNAKPILYSFRRCPYAMRARLALHSAQQKVELREIILRDKPQEMLNASPKGTVPVLLLPDGTVIDESLDIALWALQQNDPFDFLASSNAAQHTEIMALIAQFDEEFKHHLDHYKYASRKAPEGENIADYAEKHRHAALKYLHILEQKLQSQPYLFKSTQSLADIAIAPFVRQFANTDLPWFSQQNIPNVQSWLSHFINSPPFLAIMQRFERWQSDSQGVSFP